MNILDGILLTAVVLTIAPVTTDLLIQAYFTIFKTQDMIDANSVLRLVAFNYM